MSRDRKFGEDKNAVGGFCIQGDGYNHDFEFSF